MTYIPYADLINFRIKLYCKGTLIDASDDVDYIKALKKEMEDIDKEDGVYKYGSYKITIGDYHA